jgi:hypothetical protein
MGERRNAYSVLVGKLERRRPVERPRHRWKNNIEMEVQKLEGGGMDWIYLTQQREKIAGSCECGNKLLGSTKCGEIID